MPVQKIALGLLFGGRSGEHEVSLVSAASVLAALDPAKYDVVQIGIAKNGTWLCGGDVLGRLRGTAFDPTVGECTLSVDPTRRELLAIDREGRTRAIPLDAVFPVLHGPFGEDGSVQGLLELAGIPYVGAGVLASALGMDKAAQKILFERAELPVVPARVCDAAAFARDPDGTLAAIAADIGFPAFVKPPNLGSSVGISKARDAGELRAAVALALRYDRRALVERAVPAAREIEVAVLGNREPVASLPGEIVPSNEFYDYDAKYVDGASRTIVPADLAPDLAERIRGMALRAFAAIACEGLARVDFLVARESGETVVNEINTMPGFTAISMYPKMFAASGVPYPELLDRLVALAFERQEEKDALERSYAPKRAWHAAGA